MDAYTAGLEATNTNLQHLQTLTFNYHQSQKYISLLNKEIANNFQIFAREIELAKNPSLEASHQEIISLSNSKSVNEIDLSAKNGC